jgi:hypothetical protein
MFREDLTTGQRQHVAFPSIKHLLIFFVIIYHELKRLSNKTVHGRFYFTKEKQAVDFRFIIFLLTVSGLFNFINGNVA